MLNPLAATGRFFTWWGQSLLGCLPEKWHAYLTGAKSHFDLVIKHQRGSIVLMTEQGKILDSITLTEKSELDSDDYSVEDTLMGRISNTQLKAAGNLLVDRDPPLSASRGKLDFDLTDLSLQGEIELDLVVDKNSGPDPDTRPSTNLFDQDDTSNVVALGSHRDEDATVILQDVDETLHFLESDNDKDTVIIKGDQGRLLKFDAATGPSKDSTILFRSQGGKIRQVGPDEVDSQFSGSPDQGNEVQPDDLMGAGSSAEYSAVVTLLENHLGNKKCLYFLPESRVLDLNLSYPIEAIQNIETVLKYDLEKHIPLSNLEVRYFYALQMDAAREKANAEVAVVKSEEYELLNLALSPFVGRGMLCTTEKFYRKYGNKINFLEQDTEQSWQSYIKFSNLHVALNCLLLIALLATPYLAFQQGLESIEQKSPEELSRARQLVVEFNSTNEESNFGSLLSERMNSAPRTVELLSILSRSINKKAWLHQLSYQDNEIKIKGEAESATSVSDDLNRTGLFQSIKFISSIVKNSRTGKESFELLLKLNSDE